MHDRQAAVLAGFTALEAKVLRHGRAMAGLGARASADLGEVADVAGIELAAELTAGMPRSKAPGGAGCAAPPGRRRYRGAGDG